MSDLDSENVLDAQARRTSSVEEKFELIATGGAIAVVPETVATSYARSDLAYLPVRDAPPAETCIAVAKTRREQRIQSFVTVATAALRDRQPQLAAVD